MNGASRYYAKQNSKSEILYDLNCMSNLKQSDSWKQRQAGGRWERDAAAQRISKY